MSRISVGCSRWFYRHWPGRFYPEELPTHHWFRFYAERFSCVEINASFYRFPTIERVQGWMRGAPSGFLFAVKAPRLITHIRLFRNCKEPLQALREALEPLVAAGMMGPLLFQLPPRAHYGEEMLARVLDALPVDDFLCAVEFRHPSWWQDEVYRALAERGAVFVTVFSPRMPEDFVATNGRAYVRMHGRPTHANHYTEAELAALADQLVQTDEAWVFFNNDGGAAAPHDAQVLLELLRARGAAA